SSYKKSSNHQVIRTPIFCSPTTVDEEPKLSAHHPHTIRNSCFDVATTNGIVIYSNENLCLSNGVIFTTVDKHLTDKNTPLSTTTLLIGASRLAALTKC
ncbi:hypothetical protein, partial [Lentilactobacillus buchneri]